MNQIPKTNTVAKIILMFSFLLVSITTINFPGYASTSSTTIESFILIATPTWAWLITTNFFLLYLIQCYYNQEYRISNYKEW